ncbi:MAG: aldehyde dehydrogenase family protein [Planctomycetota bacterium]|nr:MAG: aldehyde dehydrogenase family protein [Planctomycetota bacterium]
MSDRFQTRSPVDGSVYVEREYARAEDLDTTLARAREALGPWRRRGLAERRALLERMVEAVVDRSEELALELTWQMGRPLRSAPGELRGFEERARCMLALASEALAPIRPGPKQGFTREIRREPLGVVLVLAPWNYPWLTSVNGIVPALAAGNVVLLKHSEQTPLVAERYIEAAQAAGLPPGVFQYLHLTHAQVATAVADPRVDHVLFTGSVEGGRAVHRAAADRFIACGLELGGKDPAYVRADAPFEETVAALVDGAFFNSGQSCCAVERIYVHRDLYERFVPAFVEKTNELVLGDPTDPRTTLGPVVRASNAAAIMDPVDAAIAAGATAHIDPAYPGSERGPQYLGPQVLTEVDHSMKIMREETFGPVVGIVPVGSDDEAVRLMNDSPYGLTSSVWTRDLEAAWALGERVETGTWFLNRCDVLDPELAWVGVKDSGRGCTLSRIGYEHLTRPKSFHLRHAF